MNRQITPLLLATSLAAATILSSCVVPTDGSYGSTTITTYRPGHRITSLPSGYRSEAISGRTYYYHDGYYYQPQSGGYVVVDAPRSSRYYSDYSRRHRGDYSNEASARDYRGSREHQYRSDRIVTRLPDGHRVITHRGTEYYQAGDEYYSRSGNGYMVVTRPY